MAEKRHTRPHTTLPFPADHPVVLCIRCAGYYPGEAFISELEVYATPKLPQFSR